MARIHRWLPGACGPHDAVALIRPFGPTMPHETGRHHSRSRYHLTMPSRRATPLQFVNIHGQPLAVTRKPGQTVKETAQQRRSNEVAAALAPADLEQVFDALVIAGWKRGKTALIALLRALGFKREDGGSFGSEEVSAALRLPRCCVAAGRFLSPSVRLARDGERLAVDVDELQRSGSTGGHRQMVAGAGTMATRLVRHGRAERPDQRDSVARATGAG